MTTDADELLTPAESGVSGSNPTSPTEGSARSTYAAGVLSAEQSLARIQHQHRQLVWLRTALFAIAACCLVPGYFGDSYRLFLLSLGWLSAAGFLVAIVRHEHLRLEQLGQESDKRLFSELIARLDRRWNDVPAVELLPQFSRLAYADDLDVGGKAGLLSLVSLAQTYAGDLTLQGWISEPTDWNTVVSRQAAVQRLKPLRSLRIDLLRTLRASSAHRVNSYGLPKWGQTEAWLPRHRLAHLLSYVGPSLAVAGCVLAACYLGADNRSILNLALGLLAAGFLVNILVTALWGSWIHDIFQKVTGEHRAVFRYADVFSSMAALPTDDGLLDDIRRHAVEGPHSAKVGFSQLMWSVRLANLQRDPMLYLVYLVLQLLLLWDFRVLKHLEKWKTRFGPHVEQWFSALGQLEAFVSCATLADEYPSWTFPKPVSDSAVHLETRGLGHPLLPDAARVANDLRIAAPQPLLLVTGSNMAGKSTFLRTIGLNILMARTGGPVCANLFHCPMYDIATSIRVRDSLRDGVSFFMAELHRLKEVVDLAESRHAARDSGTEGPPILFLLDEILQGTNSRERQIAVASVLDKLLNSGAIGAVSTHDLDLAAASEIERVSQVVHFREYFELEGDQEVMRFDYRMRPGPTPTTNALKLLQLVGLHDKS